MNKKTQQSLARKEAILEGALILFSRQGYHGTSVRDIAKSIGMNEGLLYHYFPSKKDLISGIVERFTFSDKKISELLPKGNFTLEQMLLTITKSFLETMYEHEHFFKFSLTLLFVSEKETDSPVVKLFENRTKELAALLQETANLDHDKAIVTADSFFNGIAGYYMSKHLFQNSYIQSIQDEFFISTFVSMLISGITQ